MGAATSLLDESTSNYIKGQVDSELKEFGPYYRKQYSVTHFSQVEDELEQHTQKTTQLLKQREAPEGGEVLYEDAVLHFDETRKWRDRYVVVRANYCLECHDSLESFIKGVPARHKLLPTGGTVLTTEEKYMTMVDKCFPDTTSTVKEEFAPPLTSMPGQFPIYLRLPYRRDYYFCFKQEANNAGFLSILSACIRHQNQDFLKKKTCEVQAFLKAIQLYRQEKGKYEAWDMMIGSDVRVMANLVMEQLLPTLERDMLPHLKAKKTEKKRMWFATVEASYVLVQGHLLEGMSLLKKECGVLGRQQEVLIHSDMDHIVSARAHLEDKLRASVWEPAERFSSEAVQPYLASVLEELMEPVSAGFLEARALSEALMDELCRDLQTNGVTEDLKQKLSQMSKPNLLSCYQKIGSLSEKRPHLQERFGFSNVSSLIHSAQIDLQQLMENAGYTFELLLQKVIQDKPEQAASAMEKAKHRVLKQYDYDSSTIRKKVFQEALVAITLPHIKKNLATVCKPELQRLEQSIYTDHAHFVDVETAYESILLQTLDKEVAKVVKEAASLKKYNLLNDSRDLLRQSSRSSLYCSTPSSPGSPDRAQTPSTTAPSLEPRTPSTPPLLANGLSPAPPTPGVGGVALSSRGGEDQEVQEDQDQVFAEVTNSGDLPLGRPGGQTADTAHDTPEVPAVATPPQSAAAEATEAAIAAVTKQVETLAVAATEAVGEVQKTADESRDAPADPSEPETLSATTNQEEEEEEEDTPCAAQEAPHVTAESVAETTKKEDNELSLANQQMAPEIETGAPSSGEEMEIAAGDCGQEGESGGEKEASATPDHTEDEEEEEGEVSGSSGEPQADPEENPSAQLIPSGMADSANQTVASTLGAGETPSPLGGATSGPEGTGTGTMDSVQQIRDMMVEVIDVEELAQRFPDGVPQEEE